MKKTYVSTFFVLLLVIGTLILSDPAFGAKRVLIRLQQAYSKSLPIVGDGVTWWAKQLKEASDGNIVIKIYEPGKLVAPFEILGAVSSGKIDAGLAGSGFFCGEDPCDTHLLLHPIRP